MTDGHCIVLTTMPDEAGATKMAHAVVGSGLAACVQIMPIHSVYVWDGGVEDTRECLLMCKTRDELYPPLEEFIAERHPYDVPEILQLPVSGGLDGYLTWIDDSTAGAPG